MFWQNIFNFFKFWSVWHHWYTPWSQDQMTIGPSYLPFETYYPIPHLLSWFFPTSRLVGGLWSFPWRVSKNAAGMISSTKETTGGRWCFQIFVIFTTTWVNDPIWLIGFKIHLIPLHQRIQDLRFLRSRHLAKRSVSWWTDRAMLLGNDNGTDKWCGKLMMMMMMMMMVVIIMTMIAKNI